MHCGQDIYHKMQNYLGIQITLYIVNWVKHQIHII